MSPLQQALRQIVLRPGLSALTILMIALGIGGTSAMYSLTHDVLIQPLPVADPDRLVNLKSVGIKPGPVRCTAFVNDCVASSFSYSMFRDLQSRQTVFTGLAGHRGFEANLVYQGQARSASGTLVSGSYFDVLGLQAALGRLISPLDDSAIGEPAIVVLSYESWQNQFGGDRSIIGQSLIVNGHSLAIVGVAPDGFRGTVLGWRPQIFVPLTLRWLMEPIAAADYDRRNSYWLNLFARLRADVSMAEATATMDVLHHGIVADVEAATLSSLPASRLEQFLAQRLIIEPGSRGQSELRGTATPPLTILLVITTLVLLIVCVNIANLLLARGLSRANEMAVRASVGATRGRLVGQLLTESAVLALAGGVLSIPVAIITLRSISALLPDQLASGLAVNFSGAAALFTGGASLATLLLFGSVPAWQASGTSPGTALRGQASRLTGKRGTASFRRALSTVQIALSMVLLILAGLFTRSLANITRLDLGIRTDYLVTFTIAPRLNNYGAADADVLYDRIETALAGQPGVVTVASAGIPLLADAGMTFFPSVTGFEAAPGDNRSQSNIVSPDFFRALSIPLLAGRDFLDTDFRQPQNGAMFESTVAIVNESFAHKFFGSVNAVGKSFSIPYVADSIEIVGVVGDTKYVGVKRDVDPQFYVPGRQYGDDASLSFYVRGGTEADALLRMIPRVIADIAPAVPVSDLITMEGQIDNNIYLDRLMTVLSESFAALATLLAGIGLYGVLTYDLTQRTRELGLRLALGAQPRDLRVLVLKQVGPMVAIGGAAGVIAAVVAGRVAETLLFGLSRYDPLVLGLSVAALSGVVLVASYVPAKRASTVTPVEALRYE